MPDRKFIRRKHLMPDESSLVSSQEQARLLNDPDVPFRPVRTHTAAWVVKPAIEGDPKTPASSRIVPLLWEDDIAA